MKSNYLPFPTSHDLSSALSSAYAFPILQTKWTLKQSRMKCSSALDCIMQQTLKADIIFRTKNSGGINVNVSKYTG